MKHPNKLDQQLDNLRTLRQSYNEIAEAAESYNVGKVEMAAAISAKGVETSPTETYPQMAEKVNAISQETYEINGGEMYAKQLFGALETPNYWNLYDILTQLLSDGRLVNYGGILLAEYYRGYDSLALSGAGAGGAYVVSDKDANGDFIMYTNDTTHVWDTEDDGKGNRWVAYCFADEYHDFQITDTNTSPRSIFIGRKVGTITSLVNGRVSQIVVPDGNVLRSFHRGSTTQNFFKDLTLINIESIDETILKKTDSSVENLYIKANSTNCDVINGVDGVVPNIKNVIIVCNSFTGGVRYTELNFLYIKADVIRGHSNGLIMLGSSPKNIILESEDISTKIQHGQTLNGLLYLKYINNDKTLSVSFSADNVNLVTSTDLELQNGWNKPLYVGIFRQLTEPNMYAHILQRLKQDEEDCGDGVTITLGSTNLAKLTSAESVQLLDDLTNIYGYTFA